MCPVFQYLKSRLDNVRAVHGYLQHVNRFVKARVGIEVWTKAHTYAFEIVDQFLLFKVFCAVKGHVFDKMR